MQCPGCSHTVPDNINFCPYCGTALPRRLPAVPMGTPAGPGAPALAAAQAAAAGGSPTLELQQVDGRPAPRAFRFKVRLGGTAVSTVLVAKNGGGGFLDAAISPSDPWLEVVDPGTGQRLDRIEQADLPQQLQLRIDPARDPSIGMADRRSGLVEMTYASGGRRQTEALGVELEMEGHLQRVRRATGYALVCAGVLASLCMVPLHRVVPCLEIGELMGWWYAGFCAGWLSSGRLGWVGVLSVLTGLGALLQTVEVHYAAISAHPGTWTMLLLLVLLPWPLGVGLVRGLFTRQPQLARHVSILVPILAFGLCCGLEMLFLSY